MDAAMNYEVTELPFNDWGVEAIDYNGDGECFVTIFYGPNAEERAKEYAAWMNIS